MKQIWLLLVLVGFSLAAVFNLTDENFENQLASNDKNWFINFHASWCGEPCQKMDAVAEELAKSLHGVLNVGQVNSEQFLARRFDIQWYPTGIYLRKSVNKYYVYNGNLTVEDLTLFAAGDFKFNVPYELPPHIVSDTWLVSLTDANFDKKVLSPRGAYWGVAFVDPAKQESKIAVPHFQGLANFVKGKLNVGILEVNQSVLAFVRFKIADVPSFQVFRGGMRYEFKGDLNFEDMLSFLEGGFEKETGQKIQISEEVEEEIGDVVVLTDETFDQKTLALSPSSNEAWFIKVYAPWCGHCKAIAPIWSEVATALKHKINVGKIDAIKNNNTTARFDVDGFPALLLFRHGKFWKYDGKLRTREALTKWAVIEYNQGDNKDGWQVPPPLGQPMPIPSWADLLHTSQSDLMSMIQYNRLGVFTLVGCGSFVGFSLVFYAFGLLAVLHSMLKPEPEAKVQIAKQSPNSSPTNSNKSRQKQK